MKVNVLRHRMEFVEMPMHLVLGAVDIAKNVSLDRITITLRMHLKEQLNQSEGLTGLRGIQNERN